LLYTLFDEIGNIRNYFNADDEPAGES